MNSRPVLRGLLLTGALYFFAVSVAHWAGFKVPMLFIYFDIPSYAYQDRLIAVLSFVAAMFLFSGYKLSSFTLEIVKFIVIAGVGAVAGLLFNNAADQTMIGHKAVYWVEISMLAGYVACLLMAYLRAKAL